MKLAVALLLLELLALANIKIGYCNGSAYIGCIQSEREALLRFKQDLKDPANRLALWSDGNCCTWAGVVCNDSTGHVLELRLGNPFLHDDEPFWLEDYKDETSKLIGKINPSLLDLKHLVYLELSNNNFEKAQLPVFLGSMGSLRHIDLSRAEFTGMIPYQLGNLSNLQYLDLSSQIPLSFLYLENFSWLSGLSLLKHLDLTGVDLSPIPDGLQNLTSLEHLDLRSNNFISSIPTWLHKFTRLEYLSLRGNRLEGQISSVVGNLSSTIKSLNLDYSEVQGKIPTSIARLCNLRSISIIDVKLSQDISQIIDIFSGCVSDVIEIVDLRDNKLSSQLINELGQFKSLQGLLLGDNMISGHIPSSLGKLSSLQAVSLSNNKLNGTLSEIHFANLTSLLAFYVSGNSLTLKVSPDWVPPFKKIKSLDLGSCNSGPQFPSWINSLEHLLFLDMPNSGILGTIPSRFFKSIPRRLKHFNLSHNHIYGEISSLSEATQLESVDLNSNSLSGPIPFIPFNIRLRDLSNNALAGSLFHFLCSERNEAKHSMEFLILTNNSLSGELPDCWMNLQHLSVLKLGNNAFTGALPASMGSLTSLHSLQLDHNNLSGPIPASLQNCAKLVVFDIAWIGEKLLIMILRLRTNKFHGHIPAELCRLTSLHILDLSHNNFSGTIPRCINNLTAMMNQSNSMETDIEYYTFSNHFSIRFIENALVVMKGRELEYNTMLKLVRCMDLSGNNLSGDIPEEMTNLLALQSLNLSHNFLTGKIPENVGAMRSLESIDFSGNLLSGGIPQSISSLTFLSHLNLSDNNLTGKIPLGTQLQGFNASCFAGNNLCGAPLPKNCTDQNIR
ncbi:hypothetical protein CICLE_v10010397mg [Citrus x clementina]|uniref:Leucine-rich repeat-containing N-terminal plant-type domain-containing protein n=1 Tax=Citrus clementina TaxID=85681 RepID=V4TY35_CITCL|nr:hypothetical protein CICLE_v10010397mg [Citrus x clementina]